MRPGVTGQRYQQDLRRQPLELTYCFEAEPRLAVGAGIRRPCRLVLPVVGPVPAAFAGGRAATWRSAVSLR
jgi:hypothetical protein